MSFRGNFHLSPKYVSMFSPSILATKRSTWFLDSCMHLLWPDEYSGHSRKSLFLFVPDCRSVVDSKGRYHQMLTCMLYRYSESR